MDTSFQEAVALDRETRETACAGSSAVTWGIRGEEV
jgi:hypothetical protein